ncbi:MAG: hypothetical protein D3917_12490 [Candidatus Electrothrix sp. AX5]|nr:hypothetical protein [Candidatus Electrothrix sp. AX5]
MKKAKKMQELLNDFQIYEKRVNNEIAYNSTITNLKNRLAELEVQIDLAIAMFNSTVDDFENAMIERDNLVYLAKTAEEYYTYNDDQLRDKIVETRILRSEAALNFARDLNTAILRSYLAAKALEYKYLTPLENISLDGGQSLDINDLYRIQTPHDLDVFLNDLNNYDTGCAWGAVSERLYRISLAKDILGLTDDYLESLGAVTDSEKRQLRRERVQAFLADKIDSDSNDLAFPFSISLADEGIARYSKYNVKIWWGTASPPCDPVQAKGITVFIETTQATQLDPYVTLKLTGSQTFLNKNKEVLEYVPVSKYLNMQSIGTDSSVVTTGSFDAFVNDDPRDSTMYQWSNSFKGRSVASSSWEIVIEDFSWGNKIDWNAVTDITFFMDTMAMTLP